MEKGCDMKKKIYNIFKQINFSNYIVSIETVDSINTIDFIISIRNKFA